MDAQAEQILRAHDARQSAASQWRTVWDSLARFACPHRSGIITQRTDGEENNQDIFDSTAEESLGVFAAGVLSELTPPGEAWFRYEPANPAAPDEEKAWLAECTEIALKQIYASNFYLAWHEALIDGGVFGTLGLLAFERSPDALGPLLNFEHLPIGSFSAAENNRKMVDTISREWDWTVAQVEQEWGSESLSSAMRQAKAAGGKELDKKFRLVQEIKPRAKGQFRDGLVPGKDRPIGSVTVCATSKEVIHVDGFYESPIAVSRLERARGELWGRGPTHKAIPEVRMVNRMEYDLLIAIERMARPGWLSPDNAPYKPNNKPDGITYWDATNPQNKPEQLRSEARVDLGEQKTEQKRARIREAYFVSMFQLLSNAAEARREKTAFEVSQMLMERLKLFSPIFARIVNEALNTLLERVFGICARAGLFPPPPEGVQLSGYQVEYTSKIALAIKSARRDALIDILSLVQAIAQLDPRAVLVVDWVAEAREQALNRGVTAKNIRSLERIEEIAQQQAQMMQAQQQAEMAGTVAGAAKNLGPKAQEAAARALGI